MAILIDLSSSVEILANKASMSCNEESIFSAVFERPLVERTFLMTANDSLSISSIGLYKDRIYLRSYFLAYDRLIKIDFRWVVGCVWLYLVSPDNHVEIAAAASFSAQYRLGNSLNRQIVSVHSQCYDGL